VACVWALNIIYIFVQRYSPGTHTHAHTHVHRPKTPYSTPSRRYGHKHENTYTHMRTNTCTSRFIHINTLNHTHLRQGCSPKTWSLADPLRWPALVQQQKWLEPGTPGGHPPNEPGGSQAILLLQKRNITTHEYCRCYATLHRQTRE